MYGRYLRMSSYLAANFQLHQEKSFRYPWRSQKATYFKAGDGKCHRQEDDPFETIVD